ncbi:MAG: hypothetical protein IJA12_03320, partial [Oscillospiraceae bacterium]|nr:hypothetical protein [Oscillospiraceae bacterium]
CFYYHFVLKETDIIKVKAKPKVSLPTFFSKKVGKLPTFSVDIFSNTLYNHDIIFKWREL